MQVCYCCIGDVHGRVFPACGGESIEGEGTIAPTQCPGPPTSRTNWAGQQAVRHCTRILLVWCIPIEVAITPSAFNTHYYDTIKCHIVIQTFFSGVVSIAIYRAWSA
jgi:hypothetical protein